MLIKIKPGQNSFFLVSLILLISLPFGFFWSSLSTGLWIAHAVFWYFEHHQKGSNNRLILLWLLFCIYLFLSVIWGHNLKLGLSAITNKLYLLIIPLAGLFLPKISLKTLKKLIHCFSVFLSLTAIVFFLIALNRWFIYQYDAFLFYHELVSPLNLNAIYISYIVSVVWLLNFNLTKSYTGVFVFYQIILALFLVLLSSKNILLITVLALVFQSLFRLKSKLIKTILLLILSLSFFLVLFTENPVKDRYLAEFQTSTEEIFLNTSFDDGRAFTGTEIRLLQIRAYYNSEKSLKDILFGVGIGNSQPMIKAFHENLNTPEAYRDYNYHNQYLQILSESGFVGLILFLFFLIILIKRLSKDFTFLPFVLISISLFLTESVLYRQRGIIFFSLFMILMLKYESNESQLSHR